MGGRGSSSSMKLQSAPQPATPAAQPQIDVNGFSDTDTAGFHDLYNGKNYYQQQNLDIDARMALDDYLDPNTVPGSLYNFSQDMNYAIKLGKNLSAQQQFARDSIVDASHNLGYNVNLTRYDHGDFLDDRLAGMGITGGHDNMSISQLKQALVGQTYTDPRILSTSYNNFKNASDASTFTTREVKISYRAKASAQALMPGDGPGGKLGEMLLMPSGTKGHNNYRIVDVKASGSKARRKGGSKAVLSIPQIEVVVEVG